MYLMITLPRELWNMIYHYSSPNVLSELSKMNIQTREELSLLRFWATYIRINNIQLIDKTVDRFTAQEWINEINYVNYIRRCTDSICDCNKNENFLLGKLDYDMICIPLNSVNFDNVDILKKYSKSSSKFLSGIGSKNTGELRIHMTFWALFGPNKEKIADDSVTRSGIRSIRYQIYRNILPN